MKFQVVMVKEDGAVEPILPVWQTTFDSVFYAEKAVWEMEKFIKCPLAVREISDNRPT